MDKALIDTDILSESLKRVDPRVVARATAYLIEHHRYTLSIVSVIEVVKGWHKKQREQQIQRFLAEISAAEVLTLDL